MGHRLKEAGKTEIIDKFFPDVISGKLGNIRRSSLAAACPPGGWESLRPTSVVYPAPPFALSSSSYAG